MTKAAELAALIGSQTAQSNRNLIINGAMNVAQRGTSSTGVGAAGSSGYHNLDRYRIAFSSTAGALTMSQSAVTDLPGFANCMKFDCTTADTSIAAAEFFLVQQRFEGQNVQLLKKGTSSAEPVTVSFYAKANANATYTLELADADNGRLNSQEFSVTTSWTRVSKTFVGDTTGTLDDDNAHSFQCNIWIHAGSTYTGGTHTSNVWQTVTNQRIGENATSFFDSTDRTLEITGWQVEVGEVATPFEHRSFADDYQKCLRYYWRWTADTAYDVLANGGHDADTTCLTLYSLPVTMRTEPTASLTGSFQIRAGATNATPSSTSINRATPWNVELTHTVADNNFSGKTGRFRTDNDDDAFVEHIAEL